MSVKVNSIGLKGLEGYLVKADVKVLDGVEAFVVVGLPDASVKESRERVSTALHSMGHSLVDNKVIINLSPAEQKKNGPLFDLAIALAIAPLLRCLSLPEICRKIIRMNKLAKALL